MRRKKRSRKLLARFVWLVLLGGLSLFTLGLIRYGGPAGLWRRAQIEMASLQPHPNYVPTPLPVANNVWQTAKQGADSTQLVAHSDPVPLPTVTPTPGQLATGTLLIPTPTSTQPPFVPARSSVELNGLVHSWQTWNNCGPATLAMQLGYFGANLGQDEIGAALRTNPDDKNVSPEELADYARRQGYTAHVLVNGDSDRLRLLLSNGLPVLVETWLEDEPNNGMGHYRLLTGYDDTRAEWIAYDSYEQHGLRNPDANGAYRGIAIPYTEFDQLWQVFNRTYIVVYPANQAVIAEGILGNEVDAGSMWSRGLVAAQNEITAQPNDAFAWFNLGSDLVALGRFGEAAQAYDQARRLGLPWRMLWYQFGPFEAYQMSGRHEEVIALAEATLATTESVEELFYWRGQGLAALGDLTTAREAWQKALALNPHYTNAAAALGQ